MVLEVLGWPRRVWEGPGRFSRVWRSGRVLEDQEGYGRVGEGLSWNTMAHAADNPMIIFQARVRNLNKTCPLLQASWLNWTSL